MASTPILNHIASIWFKWEENMSRKIRIIMARLGLDAHWRGSIVVAQALRDAGMEVIYIGNQMPEVIAETALQEDADVVGLSSLSGNHMILAPKVVEILKKRGGGDILVVLGGTVPPNDIKALKEMGIAEVFGPGSSIQRIISYIKENTLRRKEHGEKGQKEVFL
jgi:methylmalonyl-CoA mutase C-terminal domain/subunit